MAAVILRKKHCIARCAYIEIREMEIIDRVKIAEIVFVKGYNCLPPYIIFYYLVENLRCFFQDSKNFNKYFVKDF